MGRRGKSFATKVLLVWSCFVISTVLPTEAILKNSGLYWDVGICSYLGIAPATHFHVGFSAALFGEAPGSVPTDIYTGRCIDRA